MLPISVKNVLIGFSGGSKLILVGLSVLIVARSLASDVKLLSRESVAMIIYLGGAFALLSGSGPLLEARYVVVGYAAIYIWVLIGLSRWASVSNLRGTSAIRINLVVGSSLVLALLLSAQGIRAARALFAVDAETLRIDRAATSMIGSACDYHPVVVGAPYFWAFLSDLESLAILSAPDNELLAYMKKYDARCVLLSDQDLDFWRPDWRTSIPAWLQQGGTTQGFHVYSRFP